MARESSQERQQRRALDDVETALRRNTAEAAVDGLLKLEAAARDRLVPAVAQLLRDEIRKAFAARQWGRLQMFAARIEREPRLVSASAQAAGGDGAGADELEARWALLWGTARSKDWPRARAQLAALRPRLQAAPALARALDAWISASGQPAGDAFGDPGDLGDRDPRLGYERRQQKPPAGPGRVDEIERAVMACFAQQPWPVFAATVKDWVRSAPADVARGTWILAAQLSVRELLAPLPAGGRPTAEPALFIARACREAGAAPELSSEILLALKVATGCFRRGEAADRDAAAVYVPIAEVAVRYPELVALVEDTVVGTPVDTTARSQVLGLLETLVQRSAAAPLWAKALRLFGLPGPEAAAPIPRWLVSGLEQILEREGELAACLRGLPPSTCAATLEPLLGAMPLPLAERTFDQLWRGADDALQRQLAALFDELLHRARAAASRRRPGRDLAHLAALLVSEGIDVDRDPAALRRMMRMPEIQRVLAGLDAEDIDHHEAPLRDGALALWRRFEDRLLPHAIRFLEIALVNAGPDRDRRRVVDAYFAGRASIIDELRALRAAAIDGCLAAFDAIERRILTDHRGDRDALATGLLTARQIDAPPGLLRELAKMLIEADAAAEGPRSASLEAALLEAHLLGPRRRRRRKQPPGPGLPGPGLPRPKRRGAQQRGAKQPAAKQPAAKQAIGPAAPRPATEPKR